VVRQNVVKSYVIIAIVIHVII